jgi:hypothetical protein
VVIRESVRLDAAAGFRDLLKKSFGIRNAGDRNDRFSGQLGKRQHI